MAEFPSNPLDTRALLDALPDALLVLSHQWHILYANPEARRLSRIPTGSLPTEPLWLLYPELPGTPLALLYQSAMATRQPTSTQFHREPDDRWYHINVTPIPEGLALHYRDITEAKHAEAAREATARRLQTVFDVTFDGIFTLDRDFNFTFLNRSAQELLGPSAVLHRNIWECFPLTRGSDFQTQYERTMHQRIPTEFEAYSAASDRWMAVDARPADEGIVVFFNDITHRRRSAETVRRQEELLAVVQQAARVATFDIDLLSGEITYGPGSFEVYGRPFTELSTVEQFTRFRLPQYHAPVREAVYQAEQTLQPVAVEFEVLDTDNQPRWIESRFQAIPVEGQARYLRGIAIDISDRKRHEAVLIASEARYRALTELNPQAIWMADPHGKLTYANQVCHDYTGIPTTPGSGATWLDVIPLYQHQRIIEAWRHAIASGSEFDLEVPLRRAADGHHRWWRLRASPVRDSEGAILYWLGIGIDIHEARTYAESLRQQHEETERQRAELQTVYETAPIGLALFDPVEFRCLRLNERQAQLFGLPKDQVLGRPVTELAPIHGLREMFEQVAAGTPIRNQVIEGTLPTSPGEHHFWTVNYFPVYAADGSVQAITAASLDITNQKKAETALIQSEKLAAVGRLASSISHEINNPLEAVTNLLYLIALTESLPTDLRQYVEMAQSELARVSQIATQTLRFHRQAVRPTSVTANELVEAVLNLYQGRLANSGIRVHTRYNTQRQFRCFENDIRQVLNNLIANAIDAMRNGGHLLLRAHDAIDPTTGQPGVRIAVADTGHGMSPAVLARIFEPFYTTKALNGTGLGLWISEGIVHRHHGRLTVRSSQHPVHHGTVFALFLPYASAHNPTQSEPIR